MHPHQSQSAQKSSIRAAVETLAMAGAHRASFRRRSSLNVRAVAAFVAAVLSSTTLGTVMALYSSPAITQFIARTAEPEDDVELIGPRSQVPARPCLTKPWLCA